MLQQKLFQKPYIKPMRKPSSPGTITDTAQRDAGKTPPKINPFLSIKGKLLIFTLCISLIPICIITTIYYFTAANALKRQILQDMTAIAESRRVHLLEFIKGRKERAIDFASDGFIRDRLEKINRGELLEPATVTALSRHLSMNKKPLDVNIIQIDVMDMDGNVVVSTNGEMVGKDMSKEAAFREGKHSSYIEQYAPDPAQGQASRLRVCTPVTSREASETVGVLVNVYDLAALNEITANRAGMGETGEVVLGQRRGDNIAFLNSLRYAPDAPLALSISLNSREAEPMRLALEESDGAIIAPDYRGADVVAAYQYMPSVDWGLVAKIDVAEAFAPLNTLRIVALVVGLVAAAVVSGVGIFFAISTSRPIRELTDATERFGAGDLDHRARVSRKDEIGSLSKSFNNMAQNLANEITGRKKAQEELKKTVTELERSNAELEQFAYVASHDLQEPLRKVSAYTQLLERRYKDKLDADANKFINYAVDAALRMQGLINDLLTYSRVHTRGTPFEPVDCSAVFDYVIANLQAAIEESGAVVTHDTLPTVVADDTQLIQLFQNLIGNAIKFRSDKAPQVHVSAEKKGKEWLFSVRDNGIGINSRYLDRIFTIFQRLHKRTDYSGTGIGLAICKKVVERHGGRIWVESEPGKGTTFYFTIPV